jgi:hypothetical protein
MSKTQKQERAHGPQLPKGEEMIAKEDFPACPVATTVGLIGNKSGNSLSCAKYLVDLKFLRTAQAIRRYKPESADG